MKTAFKTFVASSLMFAITILIFSNSTKAQETASPDTGEKTVLEVVNSKDNISAFAGLLEQAGYDRVLKKQDNTYTVLAPENEAIENADAKVKENPKKIMQGQLFKGKVPKDQVESQMGVIVKETDKSALNGIVYIVDKIVSR